VPKSASPRSTTGGEDRLFYIVIRKNLRPRAEWPPGVLGSHLTWADAEQGNGRLLLSGPALDGEGGIYLLRAEDRTEAETITSGDPAISSGCSSYELHEWDIKRGLDRFTR
jgi:uncharacterized protein YciI